MNPNDKRFFIWQHLIDYKPADSKEKRSHKQLIKLIEDSEDCFESDHLPGHITGSTLVVDKYFEYTLLTHHAKLNKWLQFGGHSDGEANTFIVCLRESLEESGLHSLKFYYPYTGIFDVDVHPIPGNDKMPKHKHFDIRIILIANMKEKLIISSESKDFSYQALC